MVKIDNLTIFSSDDVAREYIRLKDMKKRCYNPKDKDYKHYGERGIKVATKWLNDPKSFIFFALVNGSVGNTIERIDPDEGYTPNNVEFISQHENCVERQRRDCNALPRTYRKYGFLYQFQYEERILKAYKGFIKNRIRMGWSFFEALNIQKGRRADFWADIESGKIKPFWEVFLSYKDKQSVFFERVGQKINCPKCCGEKCLKLTKDYLVKCDNCGIKTKLKGEFKNGKTRNF